MRSSIRFRYMKLLLFCRQKPNLMLEISYTLAKYEDILKCSWKWNKKLSLFWFTCLWNYVQFLYNIHCLETFWKLLAYMIFPFIMLVYFFSCSSCFISCESEKDWGSLTQFPASLRMETKSFLGFPPWHKGYLITIVLDQSPGQEEGGVGWIVWPWFEMCIGVHMSWVISERSVKIKAHISPANLDAFGKVESGRKV